MFTDDEHFMLIANETEPDEEEEEDDFEDTDAEEDEEDEAVTEDIPEKS